MSELHLHPGDNLEWALELVSDPQLRAELIDEAYSLLGELAIEPVVVDEA